MKQKREFWRNDRKNNKNGVGLKNTHPSQIKSQFDGTRKIKTVILFSPSAKSFEKFKNEFDRGEKFLEIVKKLN